MGFAYAAIATVVVGYGAAEKSKEEAKNKMEASAREQKKAGMEQAAVNASQAAAERRKQVREERVRRSRILQASENTGVAGSSGETGGLSSLTTQLSANQGYSAGMQQHGQAISRFSQNAADFDLAGRRLEMEAQSFDKLSSLATSIFSMGAGASKPPAPPGATPAPNNNIFGQNDRASVR